MTARQPWTLSKARTWSPFRLTFQVYRKIDRKVKAQDALAKLVAATFVWKFGSIAVKKRSPKCEPICRQNGQVLESPELQRSDVTACFIKLQTLTEYLSFIQARRLSISNPVTCLFIVGKR